MTEIIPTSRGDVKVENRDPVITEEMKAHIAKVEGKERERGQASPHTSAATIEEKPPFSAGIINEWG